ncbi:hypothetical protein H6F96_12635 [Microcoleus sp. FACHB-53]|nr:hypothetical protein [Microcoleus sp. FACHB-53]
MQRGGNNYPVDKGNKAYCTSNVASAFCLLPPAFCLLPPAFCLLALASEVPTDESIRYVWGFQFYHWLIRSGELMDYAIAQAGIGCDRSYGSLSN